MSLWHKFYNDAMDRLFKVQRTQRIIDEHKRICLDYVASMKRLQDGHDRMQQSHLWCYARRSWIREKCLEEAVPDEEQRKAIYRKIQQEFLYRNDGRRCKMCKDDPEDKKCWLCLRNEPKPEPVDIKEIDKLIRNTEVMLAAYEKEIENKKPAPPQDRTD